MNQDQQHTIRMEHLRNKSDCWWFIWILFCKCDCQFKCPIFKWRFVRSKSYINHSINQSINPNLYSAPSRFPLLRGAPDPGQAEKNSL